MKISNIYMRKGVWTLALAMSLGLFSCTDDFFVLNNPNQPSSETFWSSEKDAQMALTACYDALQSGNLYNDNIDGWNFGILLRETCTDNGDNSWGDWMLGSSIAQCSSGTNDECFSMFWNANYELIKRCNFLTANIDRIPASEEVKNAYRAEAIALRALGYCNLVSRFRDVPYFVEPLTMETAQIAKTPKAKIVSAVIADLNKWLPALPEKSKQAKGHISQEGGYAILGRIALYGGQYKQAADAYSKVYGKFSLYKEGDGKDYSANYANLFTEKNEYCDEVILSVHYLGPALKEGQSFGVKWGAPMNAIEGSMDLANDFYCTDGLPISESPLFPDDLKKDGVYTRTNQDLRMWENRDPRLSGTLFVAGNTWNGKVYDKVTSASSTACIRKWFTPEDTSHEYDGSQDFYVIRYAEVLLGYAEALIESGSNNDLAIKCIDEVRARVGMPAVNDVEGKGKSLTQEELRKIVRHERRVELAFEDLRMADIYRWNDFDGMQSRMRVQKDKGFGVLNHKAPRGPQDYVWPIPQKEIDTNKNLEQHEEWK